MKFKLSILVLSILIIIGIVLTVGITENSSDNESTEQGEQVVEQPAVDKDKVENKVEKEVLAYQEIKAELNNAKEGNAVNWEMVSNKYGAELQASIQEINDELNTVILAAIEAGKTGQMDANIARQIIDKTTQSYFYQKQKALHKLVVQAMEQGSTDEAVSTFGEIKYLAKNIFIPTATKRDGYYQIDMVSQIENGLNLQEKALSEGNVDDYSVYKQITDKTIYRSYYLAANSYAEKIEKAAKEGEDKEELQAEQAEGWGFLQAIKGSLAGGDEEAAKNLDRIFDLSVTDPTTINANEVNDLFTKAILAKIKGYYAKAPKALEEGNITKAKETAMEGNVFLKAIEIDLTNKLGSEKASEVFTSAEKWFEAISNQDIEAVELYGSEVLEILNQLQ
ncbi:hypothetical protein BHF71_04060 [Vulcanibacillus modesticaldus]|uniref:Uncharacterized protein n=1 Tax=Vulcanibacillus modesticaldus TaxID=337097 RepID=A0A1D2YS79_9BACI|nr:hypothetical protein [Vulcanibacillus modesticaldus]OEF96910.1 hypothetical protein BHF71_04060 [Vulcanibacillus modesticaldus]